MRRNLHGGVHAAGGGAANQERDLLHAEVIVALHLGRDMLHFFKAGGDQPRQADDVGAFHARLGQDVLARHHHTHVHHFKVIALEHHGDNVFAYVMHVALHRGNDDLAFGFG